MRLSVSAYSFQRYFEDPSYTLAQAVRSAAEIGFEGFEMLPRFFKDKKGTPAECRELKKMLEGAGLEPSCYTLGTDFGLPEGPERRAMIDGVKREIDLAVVFGARTCRVESTWGPKEGEQVTFAEMTDRVVRGTKEAAEHALRLGVRLGLENHGRYMASYRQVAMIIREVKSDAYGGVPDMGNFLVVDEDPLIACRELAKYAVHVHAKDFLVRPPGTAPGEDWWWTSVGGKRLRGAIVGEGDVPVKACLDAFRRKGYDGWVSVEHEAPEDPLEGLKRSRANLLAMLGEPD